jgi:phosphoserine phosphatase
MTHILTLIAAPGATVNPAEIASSLGHTQWQWLEEGIAADIELPAALTEAQRGALVPTLDAQRIDFIVQPAAGREKKLLVSDMDSTLIHQECIDELADVLRLKAKVSAITERAMNGELDFPTALRERVGLLKDLPETSLLEVYTNRITLMEGARTLVQTMRSRGAYCLLVSGGFTFFTARVRDALGFHEDDANQLAFVDGKLTGEVVEPILDKESKKASQQRAAQQHGLELSQSLAVGDGANDLPMLLDAGLGVAYHAKPTVQAQAHHRINHNDLTALLYAQGIKKADWKN